MSTTAVPLSPYWRVSPSRTFFDNSAKNRFTANPLDRAGNLRRNDEWVAEQMARQDARFLPYLDLKPLVSVQTNTSCGAEAPWQLDWYSSADLASLIGSDSLPASSPSSSSATTIIFLGVDGESRPLFAIDVSDALEGKSNEISVKDSSKHKFMDVRSVAMQCSADDTAIAGQGRSLLNWHTKHSFCSGCGRATTLHEGGYARKCVSLAEQKTEAAATATSSASVQRRCPSPNHYPRTDPVVIMLVEDVVNDRVLLARQAHFVPGVFSALAGFMEHGESIEEAVRREIEEEAGIQVGKVTYYSSQPWPFPNSLMIGCFAEAASSELKVDPTELSDARWFTREEVRAMKDRWNEPTPDPSVDGSVVEVKPKLTSNIAIAHQLALSWLERKPL